MKKRKEYKLSSLWKVASWCKAMKNNFRLSVVLKEKIKIITTTTPWVQNKKSNTCNNINKIQNITTTTTSGLHNHFGPYFTKRDYKQIWKNKSTNHVQCGRYLCLDHVSSISPHHPKRSPQVRSVLCPENVARRSAPAPLVSFFTTFLCGITTTTEAGYFEEFQTLRLWEISNDVLPNPYSFWSRNVRVAEREKMW